MSHPSVFELARFIDAGCESDEFEAHVSACDDCARELSRLAHRSLVAHGWSGDAVLPPARRVSPALAGFIALTACFAVLVSLPLRAATPLDAFGAIAPEGEHGTPTVESHAVVRQPLIADAGAVGSR